MMDMTAPQRTLGVFAKWPTPGSVKTRLAGATSAIWAAHVAEAFLRDALDRLTPIAARRVLAFAPRDAVDVFTELARGRFELEPQIEGDLGRRMAAFFAVHGDAGPVVLVGTDSPTLPPEFIERAFSALMTAEVVLSPAADGGYVLIGCRGKVPPIFAGLDWGTPAVLGQTIARLADPAWRLALLPPWYDVDTLDDWRVLRGHLAALRRAGIDPGLPHTEALPEPP